MEILEEIDVGSNVSGLLVKFYWDNQCCIAKSRKYHRVTFVPYCGKTSGDLVSPVLFNILVDTVVQKWLADVMNNITTASAGLSGDNVGCLSLLFYANNSAMILRL